MTPPITPADFEFENGRLVKVRGMRPAYMNGYDLIETIGVLSELVWAQAATKAHEADLKEET